MVGDDLGSAVRFAREAGQVSVGIPGSMARMCSYILTSVLIAAEDLAAAEAVGAAVLARSRDAGDLWNQVSLLPLMTFLDVRAGRAEDAAAHLREALQIAVQTGSRGELLNGVYYCGYLCAATGRYAAAITMWAADAALARHAGWAWWPMDARRRDEPLREARQALGAARTRAAEERGAAMSLDTAAEYALMLTGPDSQQPQAPPGLGKLSARERELVILVAQGRTAADDSFDDSPAFRRLCWKPNWDGRWRRRWASTPAACRIGRGSCP
jgi:hypothetical protein